MGVSRVRTELEAAMGAVITSTAACDEFIDDPDGFAARYDLDATEAVSLVEMQKDLAELMPSFVQKRRRSLRNSSRRTLNVLGRGGDDLLNEYTDREPTAHRLRDDWLRFAEFVVERTEAVAATTAHGSFVAEVARFERAMVFSLQHGRSLKTVPPAQRTPADLGFEPDRPMQLASPAALEAFTWDLRAIRKFDPRTAESVHPDPCVLLFFHTGSSRGSKVLRVHPDCVPALDAIREAPGISARAASADCVRPRHALNTLAQLHSQGGVA